MSARCAWCGDDPALIAYHDREWGVPTHGESALFELLSLEGAQAGLSWRTILAKRAGYRQAFADFDVDTVAAFDDDRLAALREDAAIVRHAAKIISVRDNARAIVRLRAESAGFDAYIWSFVDGRPVINHWPNARAVPSRSATSARLSRDLKRLGFRFVGETICYAFMQAAGLVNDHVTACPRHAELAKARD